ncbi:hypothetical protein BT67DRAFT_33367 [Trichocladium antarcticum]|uniref:Fe2OG dioxygenase domain-containing protein n=1 Tax=Trichocladium antarcticum TaxID=1450529 RepID=A0AAN6UJ67_9PEZI|nr:hypothetical protein BT67DRAFT_33367 [Trichocladium antarcticum]
MPSTFTITPSMIPVVQTRKALLILDLQNDFLSADGVLQTDEPEGCLARTLELAKAFRDSGAGDVIWVRSEFECHRSLAGDGDQIITADGFLRPHRATSTRGRQPTSSAHDTGLMEADEEAFLSIPAGADKTPCVRKGTRGAAFAPAVQAAVVAGRDIVVTKSHYSAFASGQQQLVQLLRGRFVTQLYVCGALTNISIYATALDAGRHGYETTLVEDCCAYRRGMRHLNALRQLNQLTGSEAIHSDSLLDAIRPPAAPSRPTGLSPCLAKLGMDMVGSGSPEASPAAGPRSTSTKRASPQPDRGGRKRLAPPRHAPVPVEQTRPEVGPARPSNDTAPLEIDPEPSLSDGESPEKRPEEAQRTAGAATAERGELLLASAKGPAQAPRARSTKTEQQPRIRNQIRQRVLRPSSAKTPETPIPRAAKPTRTQSNAPMHTPSTTAQPHPEPDSPPSMATNDAAAPVCSAPLCEGDTTVITNVLTPGLAAGAFERLLDEVSWAGMSHMGGEVPRRIAVQGAIADDGSMPVYRHPADESPPLLPFSPTVLQIKEEIETHLGHPVNHVLIQHYRSGSDYISEHSDKTLDIAPGSFIANVSLGAERTMVFRTKRPPQKTTDDDPPAARRTHRAPLPHNSLCRMGPATNTRWLHAIRPDRRAARDKTPPEQGARVSLTFRRIATFLDAGQSRIWGQGATAKTRARARPVVNGQTDDAVAMLRAFGRENHTGSGFDWAREYGPGFDVLHMGVPKRFCAGSADALGNAAVVLALAELGVGWARGSVDGPGRFEDNDVGRAVAHGAGAVLRYLDAVYGPGRRYDQMLPREVARRFARLQQALDLRGEWRRVGEVGAVGGGGGGDGASTESETAAVRQLLATALADWEGYARDAAAAVAVSASTEPAPAPAAGDTTAATSAPGFYIAGGSQPSPADFALWPVLHDMVRVCGDGVLGAHLGQYYAAFKQRSSVAKALGPPTEE